ncbi:MULTISPECIES: glucoamylase family protein [unclassified Sinorhizobium]|uniref:glucoamylase family protein n=1 Tax=unclassified Sinorhizobium TaxID=2613772 RepID=UPI0035232642
MLQRHDDEDVALVDRLQRAAFEYFLNFTNPENGLVADTSIGGSHCSIAAVGFALSSYPVAVERGWVDRQFAVERVLTTLRFFAESRQGRERHATGHRGFYYHFLHMDTGHRAWNSELSTIDSALLFAGMLTAAAYFTESDEAETEIRTLAAMLYERADWRWALNKGKTVSMGWKPGSGFLRWRWQGYDEAIILYVLALASPAHAIPEESYAAFTESYSWMLFRDQPYLYAGPLFIHLFSHAWIDFRQIQDGPMVQRNHDYFRNTQIAIEVQRDYAERNPARFIGYSRDIWGLTASDGPPPVRRLRGGRRSNFLSYAARGAPLGPDDGTIAPWAPLACLPFDRAAALDGLKAILSTYPNLLYEDRFPGGFNPTVKSAKPEGWVDDRCVAIDQGLLVMMIENARTDFIWSLMRQSPVIKQGLERAGFTGGWLEEAVAERKRA